MPASFDSLPRFLSPAQRGLWVVAPLCLALAGTGAYAAVELDFFHVNDLATATPYVDDLYTASLGVSVSTGRYSYALYEDMFTDQRNDARFDETHLAVSRTLPPVGGWQLRAELGLVRVGEGIFGERAQNRLHRLLGIDERELTYVDDNELHATIGFTAHRPFPAGDSVTAGPWIELCQAFDFKNHAIAGAAFEWKATPRLWLQWRAAARYSGTELDVLEPWVDGWAPAGEIGLRYTRFLRASYSYNAFGTEDHHIHLHFRWRFE